MANTAESLEAYAIRIFEEKKKRDKNKAQKLEEEQNRTLPLSLPLPTTVNTNGHLRPIEKMQMDLLNKGRDGVLKCDPLYPGSEYPTILTRLPIFIPGHPSRQKEYLDEEFALPFKNSWWTGRRHGPPLTTYDEDTLIALGLLRKYSLEGYPDNFPVTISPLAEGRYSQSHKKEKVHLIVCTLADIQRICDTSKGGKNNKLRLDSINRLTATAIQVVTTSENKKGKHGTTYKLFDVLWEAWDNDAILYIQITPILAEWFEQDFTLIDWEVRCQLSGFGKALHRFLSGQRKGGYSISLLKLKEVLFVLDRPKEFSSKLRASLDKLIEVEWLKEASITGTARQSNQILHTQR